MKCCPECFGDRGLRHNIFPLLAAEKGTCSFCTMENQALLNPKQLQDYFELLVSAYRPDANGKLLVHWFRNDWGLFMNPIMNDAKAKELLGEVLDDVPDERAHRRGDAPVEARQVGEGEALRVGEASDEVLRRDRESVKYAASEHG